MVDFTNAQQSGAGTNGVPDSHFQEASAHDIETGRQIPAVVQGPQVRGRNYDWVDIEDDEGYYVGFKFRAWINYPSSILDDVNLTTDPLDSEEKQKADEEKRLAAMGKLYIEHNGWRDYDGNPYPPMSDTKAFWNAIPNELAALCRVALTRRVGKSAVSMGRRRYS